MIGAIGSVAAGMKIGDAYYDITGNLDPLEQSINQSRGMLTGMSGQFEMAAKRTGLAMTAVGTAMLAPIGASVKAAADFEQAITNAATVTGKTGNEFEKARDQMGEMALTLGKTTVFSAREAANAFYDLSSKGFDVAAMSVAEIEPMLNLAAATQTDLTRSTEITTSTLRAFGLENSETARIADVFTRSIGSSAANMEKLGGSMVYVAPVAKAAGVTLEETTAVLSKLYDAGYEGSMAGTALRGVIIDLMNPSERLSAKLAEVGVNVEDVTLGNVDLMTALENLAKSGLSAGDMLEEFGRRGGPAALTAIEVAGAAREMDQDLQNAGGTAKQVAEMQLDTLNGQMRLLQSAVEGVMIEVGRALIPALVRLGDALIPTIQRIAEAAQNWPRLTTAIVGAAAAGGVFLVTMGPLVYTLGTLIGMVKTFGVVLTAATGTAGVAGVGGAGAVGLSAALGAVAIKGALVIGALAVVVPLVYGLVKAHVDLYNAQQQQIQSEEALIEKSKEYAFTLQQQGVVLDRIRMLEMNADEQREYMAEKQRQLIEYQTRAWLNYYLEREHNEKDLTHAINMARNEQITQERAAILISMNLSNEKKTALMQADSETTQAMLENLGVLEIEQKSKDSERLSSARKLAMEQERVNREATQAYINEWANATEQMKHETEAAAEHAEGIWARLIGSLRDALQFMGWGMGYGGVPDRVTGRASGGPVYHSGLYRVGERGPEVVALPRGARVLTAEQSKTITQSGHSPEIRINIEKAEMRTDADIEQTAQRLHRLIETRRRAFGAV